MTLTPSIVDQLAGLSGTIQKQLLRFGMKKTGRIYLLQAIWISN